MNSCELSVRIMQFVVPTLSAFLRDSPIRCDPAEPLKRLCGDVIRVLEDACDHGSAPFRRTIDETACLCASGCSRGSFRHYPRHPGPPTTYPASITGPASKVREWQQLIQILIDEQTLSARSGGSIACGTRTLNEARPDRCDPHRNSCPPFARCRSVSCSLRGCRKDVVRGRTSSPMGQQTSRLRTCICTR